MEAKELYRTRLQLVISYLRDKYNTKIQIQDLEECSNFSYRNLQRIFKAYYGETIGAYITRIKIENSARLLVFSSEEIKNIAEEVGYSDVQAYSKAFKKHFGITPAVFRKRKEEIFKTKPNQNIIMPFLEDRIEILKSKKVIYKSFKGKYEDDEIDVIWNQLYKEAEIQNIDTENTASFGIIWDEPLLTEKITYNYEACLEINNQIKIKKQKFKVKTIPTQKYAVFFHIGSYKTISKTYDKIFSNWLFTSKKEVSEAPFLEFYIKNESHTDNQNEYETEIYVPLKG